MSLLAPANPFPVHTRVFWLEGGKTCIGTVMDTETIEGLRFVIIQPDDRSRRLVKFPFSTVNVATKIR
ncbi:hypothetical protein VTO73DRAFT_6069 [Trametes versicolor]